MGSRSSGFVALHVRLSDVLPAAVESEVVDLFGRVLDAVDLVVVVLGVLYDVQPEQVAVVYCLLMLATRQHDAGDRPLTASRLDLNPPDEVAVLVEGLHVEASVVVCHFPRVASALPD